MAKFCTHKDANKRDQGTTRAEYTRLILKQGISEGVRSEIMAVPAELYGETVFFILAEATLVAAAFDAFDSALGKEQTLSLGKLPGFRSMVPLRGALMLRFPAQSCRCSRSI